MSGEVDVVLGTPLAIPALLLGGPALGAFLGIGAAGYAAYSVLDKMRTDYNEALQEFHERSEEEQQQRTQLAEQHTAATNLALMLANSTEVTTTENATLTFLREHARELSQQIAGMPAPDDALQTQCQTLLAAIETRPQELMRHFEAYDQLFAAYSAEVGAGADAATINSATASALALLREEIASPLLAAPECRETREQLLTQLDTVQALAAGQQSSVAAQALLLLRQRVYREVREQAERLQAREHEGREVRMLVGEMLAKLQAVSGLTMLPEFTQRAEALQRELQAELIHPSEENLSRLQQLAQAVATLFAACEKALGEQVLAGYISDNITDVLLSLGYRVEQIPGENTQQACVAAFDDSLGVQFNIDGTGHLSTEMVALNAAAVAVDPLQQEHVCSMVDQVLEALKERDWKLRERYRTHFEKHNTLRVVEMPAVESRPHESTAPSVMRVDES